MSTNLVTSGIKICKSLVILHPWERGTKKGCFPALAEMNIRIQLAKPKLCGPPREDQNKDECKGGSWGKNIPVLNFNSVCSLIS